MPIFHTFSHCAQAANALANDIASHIQTLLCQQARVRLALSGGKSPIAFFHALSQRHLDWSRVDITLVDERIVPTQHPDSNTQLLRQHLLQNQAVLANFIPIIQDDSDECCLKNREQVLHFARQHFCPADIVVLGMGEDGHTASLFPFMPELAINSATLLHTCPQNAPYERISMSFAAIKQAKRLYLAIAGEQKYAVYQQATQAINAQLPISYLLHDENIVLNVYYHN